MKRITISILLIQSLLALSCSQHLPMEIHTNSDKAKVYIDGKYVGQGKIVKTKTPFQVNRPYDKRSEGRHTITAKREGYKDAIMVIEPNYQQDITPIGYIGAFTLGWVVLAPLWITTADGWFYYYPQHKNFKIINKQGGMFEVHLEFEKD